MDYQLTIFENKSDNIMTMIFKSNISLNIKKLYPKKLELNFDQIILSPGIDINNANYQSS